MVVTTAKNFPQYPIPKVAQYPTQLLPTDSYQLIKMLQNITAINTTKRLVCEEKLSSLQHYHPALNISKTLCVWCMWPHSQFRTSCSCAFSLLSRKCFRYINSNFTLFIRTVNNQKIIRKHDAATRLVKYPNVSAFFSWALF